MSGVLCSAVSVKIEITRWFENYQPGIVECSLKDRAGRQWRLTCKQVYVCDEDLSEDSVYPRPGRISCSVLSRSRDDAGRAVAAIEIDPPLVNLTEDGVDRFEVFADDLILA